MQAMCVFFVVYCGFGIDWFYPYISGLQEYSYVLCMVVILF